MMVDDIYYPDGSEEKKRGKKKVDYYLSIQHNSCKLNRVPLTTACHGDFLVNLEDVRKLNSKFIRIEAVNSDKYIISRELLMNAIIKIEKS